MKAIVYEAPRQFKYKEVPEPEIESDDVLVRIDACGLCGTDLHIHEGEFAPNFPLIPGHEFTGKIVALGGAVKNLQQRQRVVGNSNESCGKCFYCLRGDFLLCLNLRAYGVTQDGGFAQYLRIKADRIFPISNLSYREAVIVPASWYGGANVVCNPRDGSSGHETRERCSPVRRWSNRPGPRPIAQIEWS